jgi:hypothetical protein
MEPIAEQLEGEPTEDGGGEDKRLIEVDSEREGGGDVSALRCPGFHSGFDYQECQLYAGGRGLRLPSRGPSLPWCIP